MVRGRHFWCDHRRRNPHRGAWRKQPERLLWYHRGAVSDWLVGEEYSSIPTVRDEEYSRIVEHHNTLVFARDKDSYCSPEPHSTTYAPQYACDITDTTYICELTCLLLPTISPIRLCTGTALGHIVVSGAKSWVEFYGLRLEARKQDAAVAAIRFESCDNVVSGGMVGHSWVDADL